MTDRIRIDQLTAGFADGDAVSSDALLMQAQFRALGHDSEIFTDPAHVTPGLRGQCRDYKEYAGRPGDVLVYHFSIGSPVTTVFRRTPARRVMRYHNITPAEFFRAFDERVAHQLVDARRELMDLARDADAVWPVSQYNASELDGVAGGKVALLPLLFSPAAFGSEDDPSILARFPEPMTTWLFVGRMAPNKRIEDLIQAFAWYRRALNPCSRLILVGSDRSCPRYFTMLRMLAADTGLRDICFEGFVSAQGLSTYYRMASLFVCASRHEGFCLPLIEAMHHGVPVIAQRTGGVPEALNGAGVLVDDPTPERFGALCHLVLQDANVRATILDSQARRLQELSRRDVAAELRALLSALPPTGSRI